ncbi:MAG: pterin-4-alpha-carbinolamine dehydratase, partial [Comamonadaceae bacterium]
YNRCVVRLNTHDVNGISSTDVECAAQFDALIA